MMHKEKGAKRHTIYPKGIIGLQNPQWLAQSFMKRP
jgi:hypothetical protein